MAAQKGTASHAKAQQKWKVSLEVASVDYTLDMKHWGDGIHFINFVANTAARTYASDSGSYCPGNGQK